MEGVGLVVLVVLRGEVVWFFFESGGGRVGGFLVSCRFFAFKFFYFFVLSFIGYCFGRFFYSLLFSLGRVRE